MNSFSKGLIIGFFLKEKIKKVVSFLVINAIDKFHSISSKNKAFRQENGITDISIIYHITNEEIFQETFKNRFQPGWVYSPQKKALKIPIDPEILNNPIIGGGYYFYELLNLDTPDGYLITLDVDLFETFGNPYLYVTYYIDYQKYINVYSKSQLIQKSDFTQLKNTNYYSNILCSSIKSPKNKNEYITNYLKLFYNNLEFTPLMIYLNYNNLDLPIDSIELLIMKDRCIKTYKLNEKIS